MLGEDGRPVAAHSIWVDVTDRVLAQAESARLAEQNLYLQQELKSVHNFEEIVGRSPALVAVLDKVRRVAPTDATVLIYGETGTGKELIARAIHSASQRSDKPLIKINCAALPAGLVESELFGHEKGAFTGAIARRTGRFELADGGTIFLDEIGELPADTQAKLLRVLQEHEFDLVGGTSKTVDVRVIAATNRDLLKAVHEKAFREDLYYRLSVFPIRLPPLRERAEDIPMLAMFLLEKFALRVGRRFEGFAPRVLPRLAAYPWPGNVRELENILERAVILSAGPLLRRRSRSPRSPRLRKPRAPSISHWTKSRKATSSTFWERPGGSSKALKARQRSWDSIRIRCAAASRSLDSRGLPTNGRSSHEISWRHPIRGRGEVAPARSPE